MPWHPQTHYLKGERVTYGGVMFECVTAHFGSLHPINSKCWKLIRRNEKEKKDIFKEQPKTEILYKDLIDYNCPICFVDKSPVAAIDCGHVFCSNCLDKICIGFSPKCPKCRKSIFKRLPLFV